MQKNEEMLKEAPFKQLIMNLCIPTIMIMLVMTIYNMADTYFIGQTNDPCKIAAISLSGPVFSILSGLGTLFGSGGCTVVSLSLGEKKYGRIRAVTSLCFYGSVLIGCVFLAVVNLNITGIARAIGSDSDTIVYTVSYLRIIAFGAPVILFTNVFANLIRADGAAKQSMIANGIGTIANIILDPILIIGLRMGVRGAAIATVAGNVISASYLLYYVIKKQKLFSLKLQDVSFEKKVIIPVFTLGLPLACGTILMSCSHMLMNNVLVSYGSAAVAANGVAGKAGMLINMIQMGICMGMQPALSYNCGAKNYGRMHQIVRNTGIMTVILGSILTILCFVFRKEFVLAFIDHEQVIALGQKMVVASMLIGPVYGLYQLAVTFLQSTGKAGYATMISLLDKGIVFIPMLYLLNGLFGLEGVIYTAVITDLISILAGGILSFSWNKKLTTATQA
ncbi:MATE efflux family protein [Lachnospiraceae bacterium M18-1]|jgi:multidrug efflux pump|nr:MATE family efflux transporter [uncultured Schaedlerella sp.]EOS40046.1 MATE efflux family protein [Lachnospiraceae bacterium M18-1]MCI9154469.1 MATE family efflux transporter [Ruminococcus sp.]